MPDITTIDALRHQIYTAMQLEHATVPVYITAFYSIRQVYPSGPGEPSTNTGLRDILRVILVEEMLHLAIAANLMNAVGGKVDLTTPNFLPPYPQRLPDGEDDFTIGLGPFSEGQLETFLKIERPSLAPDPQRKVIATHLDQVSALVPQPPGKPELRYHSIGDFYAAIAESLVYLEDEAKATPRKTIFTGKPEWQARFEHYYSGGGHLEPITNLDSALRNLRLVIEQGEGGTKQPYGSAGELAHYYRFQQIKKKRYYLPHDAADHPTGPKFRVDFNSIYPVKPNIQLADYPKGSVLAQAARDFNTAYFEFLALLTRAFNGEVDLLHKAIPMMIKFRDRCDLLMRNPLPGTEYHAGPTFEIDWAAGKAALAEAKAVGAMS